MVRWPMLTAVLAVSACGSDPCPPPPQTCPQTAPHYQPDVATAIQANCTICHYPGGTGANQPLTSYNEIYAVRLTVQGQIASCKMTPPGWPPMTAAVRDMVLAWLVCGAPNN
jgi:hypothetical protein